MAGYPPYRGPPPTQYPAYPSFPGGPTTVPQGGPVRAGIGAPGQAPNQPPANLPAIPQAANVAANAEKFSLFLGSIGEGISDEGLERILNTAGPLLALKRMRDPSGKPKAFGFAEFSDPESVLRCLEVINGATLGVGPSAKKITVKADDKTRARLDQFEAGRVKTEDQEEQLSKTREALAEVLEQMKDPTFQDSSSQEKGGSDNKGTPSHLQDLGPEDLPEESRGIITREIAFFRERAAKKEALKREEEEERERRRTGGGRGFGGGFGHRGGATGGFGQRSGPQGSFGSPQNASANAGRAGSPAVGGTSANGFGGAQSHNRPLGFVRSGLDGAEADAAAIGADEDQERARQERRKREAEAAFADRERRWENRERARANAIQRDRAKEAHDQELEDRSRVESLEIFATWDDDKQADKSRGELYYIDRMRWRAARRQHRLREIDNDRRDAELEGQQLETLKRESEDFLNKQAEMFAKMTEGKQRKSGVLLDENTPIKLSFGVAKGAKPAGGAPLREEKADVFGGADEDEEVGRRKRELVPLSYSDDEEGKAEEEGMTEEEKVERRKRKVKEIIDSIPADKDGLWQWNVRWESITESIISEKLQPFAVKKTVEYLGFQEDELVNAVIEHVREKKGAQQLLEEMEPVLAEEAEEFVIKFWRMLIFETLAVEKKIMTTV